MYSETNKFASAFYQTENGKPKLMAYVSKRLPDTAQNYSIIESELCGLGMNIVSFAHLLKKGRFDVNVDHSALTT